MDSKRIADITDIILFIYASGAYEMRVFWGGLPLKRCPILFCVAAEVCLLDPDQICPEKVVVLGPGLTNAYCGEEAEFIIDGSTAGPGKWLSKVFVINLTLSAMHNRSRI